MRLPTPEEINAVARAEGVADQNLPFMRITDKKKFREMGGRTGDEKPSIWGISAAPSTRWIVTQPSGIYDMLEGETDSALGAADAYWELITESWSVAIWDRENNVGWYSEYFGEGWIDALRQDYPEAFVEYPSGGAGSGASAGFDPNDVAVINAHRARIGGDPIDLNAAWGVEELHEMADNIRQHGRTNNPRGAARNSSLKRKLMG